MGDELYAGGGGHSVGGGLELPPYARLYDRAFHNDPAAGSRG
jgi:hypothetical protein